MKTPIAYYGGKTAIAHHILDMIPAHKCYTEAFLGGGTIFFAKPPVDNETINDRLDIVINFYEVLKNNFRPLKHKIESCLISRTIHRKALKTLQKNDRRNKVELAFSFWYCCNFSYSNEIGAGIKYSNEQNTQVCRQLKNKKVRFTDHLVARVENVQIENNDAIKVLDSRNVDKAFHYIDPPYMGADQGHYKGYTENDFIQLLEFCERCEGKFLLSNYRSDVLEKFSRKNGWHSKEIEIRLKAPRKSGDSKKEILVWNYNVNQLNLFKENSCL